jgi:lipopolysaccharide/colanic/teichoic acid biosynthesis glycosyltransferase
MRSGVADRARVQGLCGETQTFDQMKVRVDAEIWYATQSSIALDIEILLRTVVEVFGNGMRTEKCGDN